MRVSLRDLIDHVNFSAFSDKEREEELFFSLETHRSFSTDSDRPGFPFGRNGRTTWRMRRMRRWNAIDIRGRRTETRREGTKKRNQGDEGRNVGGGGGGGESVEHRNSINVEMGDFATVFWVVQSLVAKHEARSDAGRSRGMMANRDGLERGEGFIYTRWTRVRTGDAREGGLWRGARFEKRRERGRGKRGGKGRRRTHRWELTGETNDAEVRSFSPYHLARWAAILLLHLVHHISSPASSFSLRLCYRSSLLVTVDRVCTSNGRSKVFLSLFLSFLFRFFVCRGDFSLYANDFRIENIFLWNQIVYLYMVKINLIICIFFFRRPIRR